MEERVVITGMGAVTPVGNDVPTMWHALVDGRSGIAQITLFDSSVIPVRIAGEVKGFDPVGIFGRREARRNDRFTLFAMAAAQQAVAESRLTFENGLKAESGVLVGTAIGGVTTLLSNYDAFNASGARRVSAFMVPMMMPNAASAMVAIQYGLRGPNFTVASACATGTHAIGESAELIRRGAAKVMICGGTEAVLLPLTVAAFANMGALSTRNDEPTQACRPFEARRDGFVMAEGAGVMVLESLEHAQERGARILAELVGYGATSDAYHIAAPEESGAGAAGAMSMAIESAGLAPEDVDYINAHGTGTPLNDRMETRAIHQVFGEHAAGLLVSSTKSMTGHLLGAAGAVEAIACAKSLETGWVHPTINYAEPDPECDLNYVPNQALEAHPKAALSNSFGFGGHNACLALRRWESQ